MSETVTVLVENTYACGRQSSSREQVPAPRPGQNLDEWWEDEVHGLTGDGHPCGAREHALYEVRITEAPDRPALVGLSTSWEG